MHDFTERFEFEVMSIHPVFVLRQHLGEIESTAFRGDELKLASGDNQGWVTVWDLDTRRPSLSIQPSASSNGILSVAWIGHPNYHSLV